MNEHLTLIELLIVSAIYPFILHAIRQRSFKEDFSRGIVHSGSALIVYFIVGCCILNLEWIAGKAIQFLFLCSIYTCFAFFRIHLDNLADKRASKYLPKLQMFLTDFSNFLPGYWRNVNIYLQDHAVIAQMYVADGKEQKELFDTLDRCESSSVSWDSLIQTFFGRYKPSEERMYCMSLLTDGKIESGDALTYKISLFTCDLSAFSSIMQDIKKRFPDHFSSDSSTNFSLTFEN